MQLAYYYLPARGLLNLSDAAARVHMDMNGGIFRPPTINTNLSKGVEINTVAGSLALC